MASENNITLDRICLAVGTRSAELLNVIHACRDNHPLGINNPYKWRSMHMMLSGKYFYRLDHRDMAYISRMADKENQR